MISTGDMYVWVHNGDVLMFLRTGNLGVFRTFVFENLSRPTDAIHLDQMDWRDYVRPATKLDKLLAGM
jgi:hypothetical protein